MARKSIIEDMIDDFITYYDNIAKFAACAVRDELYDTAYKAIEAFYKDYTPSVDGYRRHEWNFKKHSFVKYYKKQSNGTYIGGIKLSPDFLYPVYEANTDLVFDLVYSGYHGLQTGWNGGKRLEHELINGMPSWSRFDSFHNPDKKGPMSPTPMELILKKQKEIEDNMDDYISKAEEKARALRKYK